jgi:hypothetical protein
MTNIYNWTVSFELPVRRITQCQRSALKKNQALRIRTLIAKQMADAEKLTTTTIDTSLTADLIDRGIGGKGKGKDGKGRGKGSKGGKGMGKGKSKGKNKGHTPGLGLQLPLQAATGSTSSSASKPNTNLADVTCYFCHQKGHYKSQCPKWLALRSSSSYQHTRQQAPRLGLILDHLEDAVFAPDSCCLWCADSNCEGTNCASTFDPHDFQEATALFSSSFNLWWPTLSLIALLIVTRLYPVN